MNTNTYHAQRIEHADTNLNPAMRRIYPHPQDHRCLLLDDGRPVLSVIGGGHQRPFTQEEMARISAWICECWNEMAIQPHESLAPAATAMTLTNSRGRGRPRTLPVLPALPGAST